MNDARRAFARAAAAGGILGGILFTWLLTAGSTELLRWQQLGDFYDAQAHAFLDGDLAVDGEVLGIEAFDVDGRSYMYQGPVPALLRLPVVAVAGDRLDGRLTQLSMLAGLAVATAAAARLHWRVRTLLRPGAAVDRGEAVLVAALTFTSSGGGVLLFQASRAWVYHEAILWGAALALAAVHQLLTFELTRRRPALALASLFTAGALLSRVSVGLGPAAGLALVLAVAVARRRRVRDAVLATAAPAVLYTAVNHAKFGTPFDVPVAAQRLAMVDPVRRSFLEENGGSFFGVEFVPTTALRYLDPGGIRVGRLFPFVDFPAPPGPVVGDVRFDLLDRTAGLPATATLLVALTAVAAVAVWRTPVLRIPAAAAAAGAATVLPFGYVAQRYLGDFVPLLVLGGAVGLQWVLASRGHRPLVLGACLALVAVAGWVSLGLGLQYQRLWSTNVPPELRAGFLGFQEDVGTGTLPVVRANELPAKGPAGTLLVLGDCAGLYLSDGLPLTGVDRSQWASVEGSRATGWHHLRASFPDDLPAGTRLPLASTAGTSVDAETAAGGRLRFVHRTDAGLGKVGRPVRVPRGSPVDVRIVADWRIDRLTVTVGDRVVLESFYGERAPLEVGRSAAIAVESRPVEAPLCRRLRRE